MERTFNLLGISPNVVTLVHFEKMNGVNYCVCMEPLSDHEVAVMDKQKKLNGALQYIANDNELISDSNIYFYGPINLKDENDLDIIQNCDLVDKNVMDCRNWMYSNFDYDNGCFTTINDKVMLTTTWNSLQWFMFNHCKLGKPENVIVYRKKVTENYGNRRYRNV